MIIESFRKFLKNNVKKNSIFFGQNITFGSRISGLTTGIENIKNVKIYNTQNSEATLIGFGLGLMLKNKFAIYFAKQLDFLLLGMDQIVNTYNYVQFKNKIGSFSIITYIVDSGFEGPQSRLHALQELSSLSFVNCRYLIFPDDINVSLKQIKKKNFNIFCLSQKNFKNKNSPKLVKHFKNQNIFQYKKGKKGTVISLGFSSYEAYNYIKKNNLDVDFFVITDPTANIKKNLIDKIICKKFVYLFDDTRSKIKNSENIFKDILLHDSKIKVKTFYRNENKNKLLVNDDKYISQ